MIGNSCDSPTPRQTRAIKPTKRSLSGVFPLKNQAGIAYESLLERDFLFRTSFSVEVDAIIPQPVKIDFTGRDGRMFQYTPDFLVYYHLGNRHYDDYPKPMLVEVKPEKEWRANWRKWLPKWKAAWRYAHDQGWVFHIHDENRIRDNVFSNIQFLERYKRFNFPAENTDWVLETVRQMGTVPFHYLLARHFSGIYKAEGISLIWHLVATRQLDCDIRQPLNSFLELWVPER